MRAVGLRVWCMLVIAVVGQGRFAAAQERNSVRETACQTVDLAPTSKEDSPGSEQTHSQRVEDGAVEKAPLDGQAVEFLDALKAQGGPTWEEMGAKQAREVFSGLTSVFGEGPADVEVEDRGITVSSPVRTVPVRIYRPSQTSGQLPTVLYFHGGGWVVGSLDTHDALCRRLCAWADCCVVSVAYRLAPEHPYPAGFNDCYAVLRWVADNSQELDISKYKIVVGGDSSGGNLAAAVALRCRDEDGPPVQGQVLIYPVLDSMQATSSYVKYASGYGLTAADMSWFWKQYLAGRKAGKYASPNQARSLEGLPPTMIVTAGYDVLCDEGVAYAKRLEAAGNDVRHLHYSGMIHGFVHYAGAFERGLAATRSITEQLNEWFEN